MTEDIVTGMGRGPADGKRRSYGTLRPIGAVLPPVVRPAFRAAGATAGQLMADWPSIVGPGLAALSTPRRLTAGTLTLGCSGPVAMELQHLATMLLERVNGHLGRGLVKRLRFVQEARPPTPASPPTLRTDPQPVAIEGLPPGPLAEALARLGSRVARGSLAKALDATT